MNENDFVTTDNNSIYEKSWNTLRLSYFTLYFI